MAPTPAAMAPAPPARAVLLLLRTGLVDGHRPPAVVLPVELLDRRLSLCVAAHLDEAEAFAAAGIAIGDQLGRFDGAHCRELSGDIFFGSRERQIADV